MNKNIYPVIRVNKLCINATAKNDLEKSHIKNKNTGYAGVLMSNTGVSEFNRSSATAQYEALSLESTSTG